MRKSAVIFGLVLVPVLTLAVSIVSLAQTVSQRGDSLTREEWRRSMVKIQTGGGCFMASYPETTWEQLDCMPPARVPYIFAHGTPPETVGNGTDYVAEVTSGTISSSEGAFLATPNVTSETTDSGTIANAFSLQINAQPFATTACSKGTSECKGWEQFIYSSYTSGGVFIEYSLLYYTTSSTGCPSGWTAYETPLNGQVYYTCYFNTPVTEGPTAPTAEELRQMTLTGTATTGGNDEVILSDDDTLYELSYADNTLNLAGAWTESEFNVFGDCCGYEASFNTGATLIVQNTVDNGTTNAPSYIAGGYTGETNSLTLVSTSPVGCPFGGSSTGIVFMESSATSVPTPSCSYLKHPYAWLTPVTSLLL